MGPGGFYVSQPAALRLYVECMGPSGFTILNPPPSDSMQNCTGPGGFTITVSTRHRETLHLL
jgi:hypothetical protein